MDSHSQGGSVGSRFPERIKQRVRPLHKEFSPDENVATVVKDNSPEKLELLILR